MRRRGPSALFVVLAFTAACAPAIRSSIKGLPPPALMSEFWNPPGDPGRRDLIHGAGGRRGAPDPRATYQFVDEENRGFSRKLEVKDPSGAIWDVKLGPEAQPEIVSSRIVWAMGYHQPPGYYLPVWRMVEKSGRQLDMPPARFLPNRPEFEKKGTWSWRRNPFVNTRQFRGLLVLMMVLNSTDLKDDNNAVYEVEQVNGTTARWYVVKDLGASLGETGRVAPARGNPAAFEQHGFIRQVSGDRVIFDFKGRHDDLLNIVGSEDVAWMCTELGRLSAADWRGAFSAGGYNDDDSSRFIRKLQEKIAQGKALAGRGGA